MFPFPVVLVGVSDKLAAAVRHELANVAATVEAEYRGTDTALEGLSADPAALKLFIVHFDSPADARGLRRLAETRRGSPVLALVNVDEETEYLLEANRAGATQVVPLPVEPGDLYRALTCLAMQYRPATSDCPIIAFTGSASGCGATTLATNAAYEIAVKRKQHVVLVELAQQMGVLASNLDLRPAFTLGDLLANPEEIDGELVQKSLVRVADNFDILAGSRGTGPTNAFSLSGVLRVLEYVKPLCECIVLDVPCTYDEFQFEALGNAGQIVLVGEQSIASIRTLKLILDTLRPAPVQHRVHVVINRYNSSMQALTLDNLERVLGLRNVLTIPDDRAAVLAAANEGKLLRQTNTQSPVLTGIDYLVNTLVGVHDTPVRSSGGRLLGRLLNAFRK